MSGFEYDVQRATAALNLGRGDEARRILAPLLSAAPDDGRVLALCAEAARQSGDIAQARSLVGRAAAASAGDSEVFVLCALVSSRCGDELDTHRWLTQALALDPDNVQGQNLMALTLNRLGRPDEACAHLEVALRLRPDDPMVLNTAGILTSAAGGALVWWARALQSQPDYPIAMRNLGAMLVDVGAMRRGGRMIARAIALDPACADVGETLQVAARAARRVLVGRLSVVVGAVGTASWFSATLAVILGVCGAVWLGLSVLGLRSALWSRLGADPHRIDAIDAVVLVLGLVFPPLPLAWGLLILSGRWRDRVVGYRRLREAGLAHLAQ